MIPKEHPAMTDTQPTEATDPLLAFVLSILTPLLATGGFTGAAQAARQAIAAYTTAGQNQWINIAQIVGFALASLDNLRLSADPDLSVSMKLKLRGNANALALSSQRTTATLETHPQTPQPDDTAAIAEALASLEQARIDIQQPAPPAEPTPKPATRQEIWATAMTEMAAECSRNLGKLPPRERRAEIIRIGALSATASHLARGGATPAKSGLLNTTAMGNF
jgi:hypothetical protein